MIPVLFELGRDPKGRCVSGERVTGFQWAWLFEHPEVEGPDGQPVSELGELHIPAGREIAVTLTSMDVNPQLWGAEARGDAGRRDGQQYTSCGSKPTTRVVLPVSAASSAASVTRR